MDGWVEKTNFLWLNLDGPAHTHGIGTIWDQTIGRYSSLIYERKWYIPTR